MNKSDPIEKSNKERLNYFNEYVQPNMDYIIDAAGGAERLEFNEESIVQEIGLSINQMLFTHRVNGEMPFKRNVENILGYTNEEFTQDLLISEGFIHPEDSKAFWEFNYLGVEHEIKHPAKPLSREYGFTARMKKKNAAYHYIRITVSIIAVNENKHPMTVLQIYSDLGKETLFSPSGMSISERKPYVRDAFSKIVFREDAPFTVREREIMSLLVAGKSSKMIADKLELAKNTIDGYRKKLLKKTNSGNIAELASKAVLYAWV